MASCFDYAVHYISRYPKTEFELRLQLRKKKYGEDEIDSSIQILKDKNYVNDYQYAKLYVNSEVGRKGKPLGPILMKLKSKWVSKEIIQQVKWELDDEIQSWTQAKIAREIEKYKAKGMNGFDIIQKLRSRGYRIQDIKKVVEGNAGEESQ
mgnify:CR=1 FL=1